MKFYTVSVTFFQVIKNFNGELCGHYPTKIILLEYQLTEADQKKDNFHGSVNLIHVIFK